jgi:hypothetical protein
MPVAPVEERDAEHIADIVGGDPHSERPGGVLIRDMATTVVVTLLQNMFLVSVDNPFLISAVLADTICTI